MPENRERCCGSVDMSKLGRCRRCLILATSLSVVSWAVYAIVRQRLSLPWLTAGVMIYSCLLSLLLLAHLIAFFVKQRE